MAHKKQGLSRFIKLRYAFAFVAGMNAQYVAAPLLLDGFDDHLRTRGLDAAVAAGLADHDIYVHSETGRTQLYDIIKPSLLWDKPESPYALLGAHDRLLGQCRLVLFDLDVRQIAADLSGTSIDAVRDVSHLQKAFNDYIALHEARHCHTDNRALGNHSSEADADIHALRALAGQEYARELGILVRHFRALGLMKTLSHDTSASLYAEAQGRPLPSEAEIVMTETNIIAAVRMDMMMTCYAEQMRDMPADRLTPAIQATLRQSREGHPAFMPEILQKLYDNDRLEAAARARVGQYLAAVRYFLPQVGAELRDGQTPEWRCAPL